MAGFTSRAAVMDLSGVEHKPIYKRVQHEYHVIPHHDAKTIDTGFVAPISIVIPDFTHRVERHHTALKTEGKAHGWE
jgi:hypothetical protein